MIFCEWGCCISGIPHFLITLILFCQLKKSRFMRRRFNYWNVVYASLSVGLLNAEYGRTARASVLFTS